MAGLLIVKTLVIRFVCAFGNSANHFTRTPIFANTSRETKNGFHLERELPGDLFWPADYTASGTLRPYVPLWSVHRWEGSGDMMTSGSDLVRQDAIPKSSLAGPCQRKAYASRRVNLSPIKGTRPIDRGTSVIVISKMELSADDPTRIALPVMLLKRPGFTHRASWTIQGQDFKIVIQDPPSPLEISNYKLS